jgi:hypothetical protein
MEVTMLNNDETGLLEFLLRDGVTPSFSFPLDVCEFKVEGLTDENGSGYRPKTWAKMGQDLRKALIEYSPGREIVVNGESYVVGGLSFFNPPDLINQARHIFQERLNSPSLKWYNRCLENRCGWVSKEMNSKIEIDACPVCAEGEVRGNRWYRPEGFAPILVPFNSKGEKEKTRNKFWKGRSHWMKAEPPRSIQTETTTGRIELPSPLLGDDAEEITHHPMDQIEELNSLSERLQLYSSRKEEDNPESGIELILINSGLNNSGYWLCPDCGRMELKRNKPFYNGPDNDGHHRPYAAQWRRSEEPSEPRKQEARAICKTHPLGKEEGEIEANGKIMLGMTFRTDLALFRFVKPPEFLEGKKLAKLRSFDGGIRAIKEAMVEEIQRTRGFVNREISGGVRKFASSNDEGSRLYYTDIFLYDEVSGGAGLTHEVIEHLEELPHIFKQIEQRLSGVECIEATGCDMACINCLLDYRNIREHDRLDRKNGLRLIRYIRHGILPTLESGEQDIEIRPSFEARKIANHLKIDTGFEVSIEIKNEHQYFKIRNGKRELNLRPLSQMVKPEHDPILQNETHRTRTELNLEQASRYRDGRMYYLHISRFESLRTKVASVIKGMLLSSDEQDL